MYFGYCSLTATAEAGVSTLTGEVTTTVVPGGGETGLESLGESSGGLHTLGRDTQVYEMVMSVGWNPYYKNSVRSVEVDVMHDLKGDFYGARMRLLMLGFVREELDYISKEALIEDIRTDIQVTRRSLARGNWGRYRVDEWLKEG